MRFLVDAQLPPALARWLVEHGHLAEHVFDLGLERANDLDIWHRAQKHASVIVTKDEDFVTLRLTGTGGPAILWIRLGNTRKSALLAALEPLLPAIIEALERGESLVEIV